ncbi:MAG TPA: preprotein translocase subunit SecG [Clostridiales bacterium]|mgnify:FL=1|nr:preprotein translocase subunit SecG [Clostridiales bacterium]
MLKTIVTVLYVIICIALIVLVLMQEGKAGLSSTISGSSNSYWGKNKDNSIEGSIPKITGALAAIFIVLSVVLNVL